MTERGRKERLGAPVSPLATHEMDKSGVPSSAPIVKSESGLSQEDERIREFQNNPNVPADAKVMALLLRSSGVTDYDPKIINQLLDFMHRTSSRNSALGHISKPRQGPFFLLANFQSTLLTNCTALGYLTDLIVDAEDFRAHADKRAIDMEDIKLAIHTRVAHSFIQPPPRQVCALALRRPYDSLPVI
jgi:hypothetical protein